MSAVPPQGGFLAGLGSLLGGGTTPEEQRRAALFQAGLATLAGAQQPGATLGGSLFGGFQAGAQSLQQAQQNQFQSKRLKSQEDREDRLEKQEADRIAAAQAEVTRKGRERGATVAQRFATGVENNKSNLLGYYNNIASRDPEFRATAQQYGFDLASITTPEQVLELGNQLGALGGVGAETPRDPGEPLEAVIDENGKPVLRRRSQADGQTPYYRPDRRGLAVTLPDGTTISDGPGVVQPGELTKPTQNKLQESIVNAQDRLDRLNSTLETYKPEFLQARGLIKGKGGQLLEFLGGELSPENEKYLTEYSEFIATAANDFNQTIREQSGATVTEGEAKRALQAAPSPDDKSPTQFEAKARATTKTLKRAILRANYALKNGIGTKSLDELSKLIPLESIDAIYEERVNNIFQEIGGTDAKDPDQSQLKQKAIIQAKQEFGIAR